jgi:pimeloyl-ACP methyl ester carboxylesterase
MRMTEAHRFLLGPCVRAKAGPVLVVASSMGAVLGLNWTLRHRDQVCGVVLACPVLDLTSLYDTDRGDAFNVGAAYGVTPPSKIPELADHSPAEYASELCGLPIRIYASRNDPVAADTAECLDFAVRVGGAQIEVADLGAAGHWPVGTPIDDVLEFTARFI